MADEECVSKIRGIGPTGRRNHPNCMWARILFAMIMLPTLFLSACSDYATFSSRVKQLDFTFEYPRGWWVSPVEKYSDLVRVSIDCAVTSENESDVGVSIDVWLGLDSQAEQEAQDRLSEDISLFKGFSNFVVVRQGNITLDGCSGYEVECTYDFSSSWLEPAKTRFPIPTRVLNITVPRNGMVYQIMISAHQSAWNAHVKDIQHILDTFRWK